MNVLSGKTALVTGATGGIGTAIAESLATQGCNLILICRGSRKCANLVSRLEHYKINIEVIWCDFEDQTEVMEMLSSLKEKTVDILINNAGQFPLKSILDSSIEDYDNCFNVNVKAPFILAKVLGKSMCDRSWGRIVNIGSSSSYNGSGETGLYCASKHALLGLSRSLYQEFKPHNVRVYSVSPGSVQSDMGKTDTRQDFNTFITPEEVAKYICFIISFDGEGIAEESRINRMVIR